ncbi:MAG TPA: histidine kinase [Gemmatimonadaceae bacterium]
MESTRTKANRERAVFWAAVSGIWTLLVVLSIGQTALHLAHRGGTIPWTRIIATHLVDWSTFGLFLPPLFWLARRFPIERERWRRNLFVQLLASVLCVVAQYALYVPLARFVVGPEQSLSGLLASMGLSELMAFWALIGIIHAVEFYRRGREREASALRLEARLADAQLHALTARLRPHFLFNTLGAISELIHRDPEGADAMITRLSNLLRATLSRPDDPLISLSEEIALGAQFIDIMRIRYGPRLSVDIRLDPPLRRALVPALVLQPLIENALEHGVARRRGPALVTIVVERVRRAEDDALQMAVTDDGPGFPPTGVTEGVGISTTRERLGQLYGTRYTFRTENTETGGARVTVTIPLAWREEDDPGRVVCAAS